MLSPAGENLARLCSLPGLRHILHFADLLAGAFGRKPLAAISISVVTVLSIGLVASLYAAHLSRSTPAWWDVTAPDDSRAVLARSTENNVIASMHQPQGQSWTLTLDQPAVNAWIAERLPRWVNHGEGEDAWPQEITDLRMIFGDGDILIAAQITGDRPRIVGATLSPRLTESGELWLPASWIHVGSLELPGAAVLARAADTEIVPASLREMPVFSQLVGALAGDQPVLDTAEIRLGDGRRVRIREIHVQQGQATIRCETFAGAS